MVFHVEYPRVVPERKPPGHQPAAPRYTLRWHDPVETMVSDYYGTQRAGLGWEEQQQFFQRVEASLAHPDGPAAHEIMRFTDEAGETNAVVVAYWLDATRHARWSATAEFPRWFSAAERLSGDAGYWKETIAVPYDRHETIYSAPHYRIGFARTANSSIESMTTNGYFGAARDRVPVSAIDPLESPLQQRPPTPRQVDSRGRRLRVATPHNMTALRSGQFWVGAGPEQLADYRENLQPKLMRGMNFLLDHKGETGTLALRVMTNLDTDGKERAETSVLAYFLSLAQLEDWSKSHETHLDIYRHAIAMNRQFKEKREVVTWHELFVMPQATSFEYVNCHAKTGVLPYFDLLEPRSA
jgi:aliphatic aldoxime dehydratase